MWGVAGGLLKLGSLGLPLTEEGGGVRGEGVFVIMSVCV